MKKIIIMTLLFVLAGTGSVYGKIAFVANVNVSWDLFAVDDSGRNPVQLTNTPYDEKDPTWSSDRTKIVYATSDGHLNIVDITAGKSRVIAAIQQKTPRITPCFSPDDKEIVFSQFRPADQGDDTDLMIFNFETKTTRSVLEQNSLQMWPAWSPDKNRLVYTNNHCSGDCGRIIQELWLADPKGGWARQLLMTNSLCLHPAWSWDGRRIAFASDKSGNFDIWVLSLDEWKMEQITLDERLDVSPAWSPDGKKIAFVSTRSGIMEIWIKNIRNGELRRLKPFGDRDVECKDVAW